MTNERTVILAMATLLTIAVLPIGALASSDMNVQWKDGLVLTSEDADTQVKIGMRIMNDWAWLDGNDALSDSLQNGTEFRRARFYVSGTLQGGVEFKGQYDFSGGKVSVKDVYVGLKKAIGPAGIRVGHFKQPVGLEVLTSSNDILLMERASIVEMVPERKTGLMIHGPIGESQRGTFAASVYRETDGDGANEGDGAYSMSARLTGLAMTTDEGDLVHLGVSGSLRETFDDVLEIDLAPEAHLAPDFGRLSTGADKWTQLGLEAAAVMGSAHVQGEYMVVSTTGAGGAPDATFSGFYGQAGVFLTGERLPYKKSSAAFSRVKPAKDFRGEEGGSGAVQLVARYSMLDLDDPDVRAGDTSAITAGVNWYLNPNARVMVNYIRSEGNTDRLDGGVLQGVQTRFHVSF